MKNDSGRVAVGKKEVMAEEPTRMQGFGSKLRKWKLHGRTQLKESNVEFW